MEGQTIRRTLVVGIVGPIVAGLIWLIVSRHIETNNTGTNVLSTRSNATRKPGLVREGPQSMPDPENGNRWDALAPLEGMRKDAVESLSPSLLAAALPMQQRIRKQILLLQDESVRESVRMLSEVEMFYWPGHGMDGMMLIVIPMRTDVGQQDIESIMSNRRFLKVFSGLSTLSKAEASELLIRELQDTMPVYKKLFEAGVEQLKQGTLNATPPGVNSSAGLSLQINNNVDHSPTLGGARLKLLSLVLLAGNLGLEGAIPAIREVAVFACQQRDRLYAAEEGLTEADRFCILRDATLYNRQILACGLLQRTSGKGSSGVAKAPWAERTLPMFDARATPYDLLSKYGGPIPPDYSKGSITVAFPPPIDDATLDSLAKGK